MEILDDEVFSNSPKTARTIDDVIEHGYQFNFGDYFNRMFQLFGKTWGYLLGHGGILAATYLLIYGVAVVLLISSLKDLGTHPAHPEDAGEVLNAMGPMFRLMLVAFVFIVVWIIAFVMPFRAGIYSFLKEGLERQQYSFGDFFRPMREKWLKLVGLVVIWFIAAFFFLGIAYWHWLSELPSMFNTITDPEAMRRNPFVVYNGMGWVWASYIPTIFFQVSFSLAIPLLIFQTDSIGKALVGSFRIVTKKWFYFFALYLVVYVLTVMGIIACGFGLLLTIQFFPLCIYAIYEDIFIRQNQTL